jgi:broad specificity phosphatase PhoE
MKKVYIIRHAEVDKMTRHYSLSSEGWENSVLFGSYLKNQNDFPIPEKFYSSDRARAIETARVILTCLGSKQSNLNIDKLFGEFNPTDEELAEVLKTEKYISLIKAGKRGILYFDWEGKQKAINDYLSAINTILTSSDSVLIVSHGNIINFILFSLFPNDIRVQNNIETPNLSLTILEKENDTFFLSKICSIDWKNYVYHNSSKR